MTLHFKPFLYNSLRPSVRRCSKSENNIYINLIFTLTFLAADCLSSFIPLFLLFHYSFVPSTYPGLVLSLLLSSLLLPFCSSVCRLFLILTFFLSFSCKLTLQVVIRHFCRQASLFSRSYADSGFEVKCIGTRTVCKRYCLTDCFDTSGNRPGQLIQTQDNSRYI